MIGLSILAMLGSNCKCTQEGDGGGGGSSGGGSSMSCPFVYTFDGQQYNYTTDLGGSVLGKNIKILQPEYYEGGLYLLQDFSPTSDEYRLKIRETQFESSYFDMARLVLADVPEGYGVVSTWSFTSQLGYVSPKYFLTIRNPRPPVWATNDDGSDVLWEISHADGQPVELTHDGISRVIVSFGKIEHPQYSKLIVTAWSQYADLETTLSPPHVPATVIETRDANGDWVIREMSGKNAGDRHSWAIDLAGLLDANDSTMRITMAHQAIGRDILDQVLFDDSRPVKLELTELSPKAAYLHSGGRATYEPQNQYHPMNAKDDYNALEPRAILSGWYTRYGDVMSLVDSVDDRFVLMSHGDSLFLSFDAPELPDGKSRSVFLAADVFYSIAFDVKQRRLTNSIYPLPYHGMTTYPYDPDHWPYKDDDSYHGYEKYYNTRLVGIGK